MAEKRTNKEDPSPKLRDLVPLKDALGGGRGRMYPENESLPIPPPGFVCSSGQIASEEVK